jgi:hypothetical protein
MATSRAASCRIRRRHGRVPTKSVTGVSVCGTMDGMDLRVLPDRLSVCRLPVDAPWPTPSAPSGFFSATRTGEEVSVVCAEDDAPAGEHVRVEPDWRALEVAGPLDFSMVGVMAALTAPLADVDVSVFVVSTYDTDYVLVHAAALEKAVEALRAAGHQVHAG